jgi:hypothetical protein
MQGMKTSLNPAQSQLTQQSDPHAYASQAPVFHLAWDVDHTIWRYLRVVSSTWCWAPDDGTQCYPVPAGTYRR